MSEATETPVEEGVEIQSPVIEAPIVETDDSSVTTTDADLADQGAEDLVDATGDAPAAETITEDLSPEAQTQQDFKDAVKILGIDLEEHGTDIREFQRLADELGITQLIATDMTEEKKAQLVKDILIAAEGDPEAGATKYSGIAAIILEGAKNAAEGFQGWLSETTQETLGSGMLRLIKALVEGANYNSAGSIRGRESENSADVISTTDFFTMMREDPTTAVRKLEGASSDLKKAGWDMGDKGAELLREGRSNTKKAKEALQAVLIGSDEMGDNSLADHLNTADHYDRWQEVSGVLAQELFDKKMISLNVKDVLDDLHSGKQKADNHAYFGT